jgi:Tat protein secretion system quality control protein TatD with DNase activity
MNRRQLLLSSLSVLISACASSKGLVEVPAAAPPRRPLDPLISSLDADVKNIPVVDFHTHLQKNVTAEELVAHQNQVGVARMVLMPNWTKDRPGVSVDDAEGSDEQAIEYARRYPDRFVPFIGFQGRGLASPEAWSWPSTIGQQRLRETEAKLRTGEFFGMGEFMLRFYPYTNRHGIISPSEIDCPPYSYLMRKFADLSARYKAPMVIHCEAEPKSKEEMIRLFEAHGDAIFVWAHNCGRSSSKDMDDMFNRFLNLFADLGGMVYSGPNVEHYGVYFPRRTPWMYLVVDEKGVILPEMKPLFEKYADRFFVGTDIAHARVYKNYEAHLPRWRSFFSQLSPAAAHKIAYQNAERLFLINRRSGQT